MDAERDPDKSTTKYNIFMVCMSNGIAGSYITAVSLSSVLWHLTTYSETPARLREELDEAIADGKMTANRIKFKESQPLPYLQACIKEGLRMCPATGLPLWREVPKRPGGIEILGRLFPEGSEVGINTWVAHYDEDIWGPDAAHYKPERWIKNDSENLKLMESFYMPFALGSRTCIERHISYLEMSKLVPMIVSQFDFDLIDKSGAFKTENYWFLKPTELRVVVKKEGSCSGIESYSMAQSPTSDQRLRYQLDFPLQCAQCIKRIRGLRADRGQLWKPARVSA